MGNKMCKKKTDTVDSGNHKSPKTFDRIITRLHLRPTSWKSDSHLNRKQVNRCETNPKGPNDKPNKIIQNRPLSKSSDWTDATLEVPEDHDHVHLRNPKLSLIFNNENEIPTPPPRKHKKNLREKLEAVAKTGLQALQTNKKPVDEPLAVKKKINYNCPLCDSDEKNHNRDHHHPHVHTNTGKSTKTQDSAKKDGKRKKNLSVISLPNYNELKLTVVDCEEIDKKKPNLNSSVLSLQSNNKKPFAAPVGGKLDNYLTRCRSFGSLLPQQLKKLKIQKAPADIESDDSFGGLEDWDLGLIEHYNPKDASLPRPRKLPKSNKDVLDGIEGLIVTEDEIERSKPKPKPPVRRSESLVKKMNKEAVETTHKVPNMESSVSLTPPPSPVQDKNENKPIADLPTRVDGRIEHSSLLHILQEFSEKDKQNGNLLDGDSLPYIDEKVESKDNSNQSSLTPSLLEFEKTLNVNTIEDFINAEKINTEHNITNYRTTAVS